MSQVTDTPAPSTKAHQSSLDRINLSFEYNMSWQDARRAFGEKTARPAAK